MNDEKLNETLKDLLNKIDNKLLETQHGVILSLGHIMERKIIGCNKGDVAAWKYPNEVVTELGKSINLNTPELPSLHIYFCCFQLKL